MAGAAGRSLLKHSGAALRATTAYSPSWQTSAHTVACRRARPAMSTSRNPARIHLPRPGRAEERNRRLRFFIQALAMSRNLQPRRWRNDRPKGDEPAPVGGPDPSTVSRVRAKYPVVACSPRDRSPDPAPGRGRRAGPCYRLQSSLSGTASVCPPASERMSSPL